MCNTGAVVSFLLLKHQMGPHGIVLFSSKISLPKVQLSVQ